MSGHTPWSEIKHERVYARPDSAAPSDPPLQTEGRSAERDPRKCSHVREDGSLCNGWAARDGLCPGHSGKIGGKTEKKKDPVLEVLGETGKDAASRPVQVLREIAEDRKAGENARVSAAKALADMDKTATLSVPRSLRAVEAMSTDELIAFVRARPLPEGGIMGQTQG